jgi:hypothetical protein
LIRLIQEHNPETITILQICTTGATGRLIAIHTRELLPLCILHD